MDSQQEDMRNVLASQQKETTDKVSIKKLANANSDVKVKIEDLEQYILGTSETINEKIEEIMRQMNELHIEIKSNIELVQEKRRVHSKDTNQFISVLCEDVRQFLSCMTDELS
jgi:hypothetical protein